MFTEDNRSESFLTQMGVKYRYTNDLHLSDLPPGWDVANDARPVAKREAAVLDYAAQMEDGSAAPAVIVHYADDRLVVLDGIQRLAAALYAGYTRFSAYVVECDSDDLLAAISVVANARLQGHAEKPEWTKRNAVSKLIIGRGMSAAEVAKFGGWKKSDLERLRIVLDWGFHIRCIGGPEKLPDGMVQHLSGLTTPAELRAAAKPVSSFLNAIDKAKFATLDAIPYLDEFFAAIAKRSNAVEIYDSRLQDFLAEPEVDTRLHGRHSLGLSGDVNLKRAMKSCIGILDKLIEDGAALRYVDEFFKLNNQIDERIRKLAPHCPQPDTPRTPADKWEKA